MIRLIHLAPCRYFLQFLVLLLCTKMYLACQEYTYIYSVYIHHLKYTHCFSHLTGKLFLQDVELPEELGQPPTLAHLLHTSYGPGFDQNGQPVNGLASKQQQPSSTSLAYGGPVSAGPVGAHLNPGNPDTQGYNAEHEVSTFFLCVYQHGQHNNTHSLTKCQCIPGIWRRSFLRTKASSVCHSWTGIRRSSAASLGASGQSRPPQFYYYFALCHHTVKTDVYLYGRHAHGASIGAAWMTIMLPISTQTT